MQEGIEGFLGFGRIIAFLALAGAFNERPQATAGRPYEYDIPCRGDMPQAADRPRYLGNGGPRCRKRPDAGPYKGNS